MCNFRCCVWWQKLKVSFFVIAGNPFLCATMVVEKLGRWEDPRVNDGPGRGDMLRSGEETEKEAVTRLPVG
jgi:hypothetical protein